MLTFGIGDFDLELPPLHFHLGYKFWFIRLKLLCLMKSKDFQFEEIHILKSICLFLQSLYFVIRTLQGTG